MQSTTHRIHLAIGNDTVRRRATAILDAREGFRVADVSPDSLFDEGESADLLIVDVDSGLDALDRIVESHREQGRPILWTGLTLIESDRLDAEDVGLSRPFAPDDLCAAAARALGIDSPISEDHERDEDDSEILEIGESSSMVLDVEELNDSYVDSGRFVGPIARESLEVASLREQAEALTAPTHTSDSTRNPTMPEVPTPREDTSESRPDSTPPPHRGSASTPTPGDSGSETGHSPGSDSHPASPPERTPGAREVSTTGDPDGTSPPRGDVRSGDGSSETSRRSEQPTPPSRPSIREESSPRASAREGSSPPPSRSSAASSAPLSPELAQRMSDAAELLAREWERLGSTARRRDRAERIERFLKTMLRRGSSAAEGELERLPSARGFSGRLEIMSFADLLQTIRRHTLRGRLEVSGRDEGLAFYVDGGRLDDIEWLEGRGDVALLDALLEADHVDESTYRRLEARLQETPAAPLEMQLRTEEIVSREALREARRRRAEWALEQAFELEQGNFAFIPLLPDEGGQAWPVDGLSIDLDPFVLAWYRRFDSLESWPELSEGAEFMTVEDRTNRIDDARLTELEAQLLEACMDLQTLDQLERRFADDRSIEPVVRRLVVVGLLSRVGDVSAEPVETVPGGDEGVSEVDDDEEAPHVPDPTGHDATP